MLLRLVSQMCAEGHGWSEGAGRVAGESGAEPLVDCRKSFLDIAGDGKQRPAAEGGTDKGDRQRRDCGQLQ